MFATSKSGKKVESKSFKPTSDKAKFKTTEAVQMQSSELFPTEKKLVKFQTGYKDKVIQESGYIVNAQWKDQANRVAIYDLVTKSGDQFRIITDPKLYPKDTLIIS